jgi:hypothetical protein
LKFERVVIDSNFPDGYQVEVADVNGDKKPDLVALGGSTVAWYENPTWKKRVISTSKETPDVISSATADLDGDGKAEVAIAFDFSMNHPERGKLVLAVQGAKPDAPWTFQPIYDVSRVVPQAVTLAGTPIAANPAPLADVRSIHRIRWGWVMGDPVVGPAGIRFEKKLELVAAPIFGPSARPPAYEQEPARLVVFNTEDKPKSGRWARRVIGDAPVLHAIELVSLDPKLPSMVLAASNLGVTSMELVQQNGEPFFERVILASGAPGNAPKRGASEVHLGHFKDGRKFLATVEPWHGTDVAIYESESLKPLKFGPRNVIDATLKEGHALWTADVDGDGDDEVFAGYRGGEGGVLIFDFDGKNWVKTVLDPAITAQDLRGGDIDGDGRPDVVAIGGKSHNVVWYRPIP